MFFERVHISAIELYSNWRECDWNRCLLTVHNKYTLGTRIFLMTFLMTFFDFANFCLSTSTRRAWCPGIFSYLAISRHPLGSNLGESHLGFIYFYEPQKRIGTFERSRLSKRVSKTNFLLPTKILSVHLPKYATDDQTTIKHHDRSLAVCLLTADD